MIKSQCETAQDGCITTEKAIDDIKTEMGRVRNEILVLLCNIRKCYKKLQNIALNDNPLSELEYIDVIIADEKSQHKYGWQGRVSALLAMRQDAEAILAISTGDFDPGKAFLDLVDEQLTETPESEEAKQIEKAKSVFLEKYAPNQCTSL